MHNSLLYLFIFYFYFSVEQINLKIQWVTGYHINYEVFKQDMVNIINYEIFKQDMRYSHFADNTNLNNLWGRYPDKIFHVCSDRRYLLLKNHALYKINKRLLKNYTTRNMYGSYTRHDNSSCQIPPKT